MIRYRRRVETADLQFHLCQKKSLLLLLRIIVRIRSDPFTTEVPGKFWHHVYREVEFHSLESRVSSGRYSICYRRRSSVKVSPSFSSSQSQSSALSGKWRLQQVQDRKEREEVFHGLLPFPTSIPASHVRTGVGIPFCGFGMDCLMTGNVRCCSNKLKWQELEGISYLSCNVTFCKILEATRLASRFRASAKDRRRCMISNPYAKCQLYLRRLRGWRTFSSLVSLDDNSYLDGDKKSSEGESILDKAYEKPSCSLLGTDELNSLLVDPERIRLVKKLSEANQHNRYLKRQLQKKDDDLVNLKSDLAILEHELQILVGLAEEVANYGFVPGTRKIDGKYIQSVILSRLQAASGKLKQHIKDVNLIKFQEVTLSWIGMAESVQVMGTFDGWSEGEEMSPEYDGFSSKFSTTLKLRPGRYEIKFLVDGEWQLSPELPTVGEGLVENNLLVVQ